MHRYRLVAFTVRSHRSLGSPLRLANSWRSREWLVHGPIVRSTTRCLAVFAILSATATQLVAQPGGRGGARGGVGAPGQAPRPTPPQPDPFRFQLLGPAEGGRISAITGVPGDARVWYLGAASGGVWKSIDSGARSAPIFDVMPVQAIGALAVAPSQAVDRLGGHGRSVGDSRRRRDGRRRLQVDRLRHHVDSTWACAETGRIQRIIVHPTNPNIVYVCALGRATGAQQEHGVYRTTDGGADVEARALARRQLRLLRAHDRREESEGAVRRHVARDHAHVGDVQRHARSEGRRLRVARRRRHVEAGRRSRAAHTRRSARSTSRSRRRTRSASTR